MPRSASSSSSGRTGHTADTSAPPARSPRAEIGIRPSWTYALAPKQDDETSVQPARARPRPTQQCHLNYCCAARVRYGAGRPIPVSPCGSRVGVAGGDTRYGPRGPPSLGLAVLAPLFEHHPQVTACFQPWTAEVDAVL